MSSIAFNESKVPLGSRELNSTNYRPARAHKHLKENRYSPLKFEMVYHGTNLESAEQIRKHGFRLNKKMKGATNVLKEASGISDENHRHFHYVSRSFTEAASYAKIYKEPEILSIVCPSEILMPDYASANEQTALKFKNGAELVKILGVFVA